MPSLNEILQSDQTNTEEAVAALKKALEEEYSFRGLSVLRFSNEHGLESSALVNLFKALEYNKTIKKLEFYADLSNEALDALITTLQKNQHLRELSLSNKGNSNLVTKLAHLLENNQTQILKLIFHLNADGANAQTDAKIFSNALEKNYTLRSLEIYGDDTLLEAFEGLQKNKTIKKLTLSYHTPFQPNTQVFANLLKKILKENHTLKSLKLYSNHRNNTPILVEALQHSQGLTHLNLRDQDVNGDTLRALSTSLQKNKTLISLNLSYNSIKGTDIPTLIELCANNPQLIDLDLSDNLITCEDTQLSTFLRTNQSLRTLKLGKIAHATVYHITTDEAFEEFAAALEHNKGLTSLIITNNSISSKKVRMLTTALQKHKTLTSLNLSRNALRDQDAPALIELCTNMPNLTDLNLEGHWMTAKGMQEFATFLETNQTLTSLNLNGYNAQAIKNLTESLKKNSRLTKLEFLCDFSHIDREFLARDLHGYYNAFEDLIKTNKTLVILDISPPPLGWLSDPADVSAIQEAYVRVQEAIKENQTKIVTKHVQEAIKPHKLGAIKPVLLNIIADYVGTPSVTKKVRPEATSVSPSALTPAPLTKSPLPSGEASSKQLSVLDRIKQKFHTAWNKLYIIIYNAWNGLKNKLKLTAKKSQTPGNDQNKSVLHPDPTVQGQVSQKEKVGLETTELTQLEVSNKSDQTKLKRS